MKPTIDEFVATEVRKAKVRTQGWHKENPYLSQIGEGCTVLDVRSYLRLGDAWEAGYRHASGVGDGGLAQTF